MFLAPIIMAAALTGTPADWAGVTRPAGQEAQPIGEYSNGCISGAVSADLKNPYYQVIRQQNRRFYGHPLLVEYISDLAGRAHDSGLPILLIGDMAMPRGGRFIRGHASHQSGLDVDIWFRMVKSPLSKSGLQTPWALTIVKDNFLETNSHYTRDTYTLIKLAATDDRVSRIFVHPAIKNQVCHDTPENDRAWVRKLRPWWGHTAHMHVRLECPAGALYCIKQPTVAEGDGCGAELESWLEDIRHPKKKKKEKPQKPVKKKVPEQCVELLNIK